ncbi:hypothetical protein IMSAGC022_00060 [Alistipes sp.]|nr:hypothetical protein IMSAGC022_00060 [Alistipes sp.]
MHPVADMTDRAYRKQNLQIRIAGCQTDNQRSVFIDYFVCKKKPAIEVVLRQFVAIGNNLSRFFLFIDISRTESQHQPIKLLHSLKGLLQTVIDILQGFLRSGCGKGAVMHRAMPQSSISKQFFLRVFFFHFNLPQSG